jgi:hypothetical protein
VRTVRMIIVAAAAALAMVVVNVPTAGAAMDKCRFGSPQRLVDAGGAVVQEWTVTDLRKSTDPAPGYPLAGQLWEATASVHAVSGTVTPIIPNFQAMSASGGRYQVLWQLSSPAGISGATIGQGQTSTGKLYFDVTGADPAGVMYMSGARGAMMWCDMDAMMSMMMSMAMDDCPCC